MRENRSSCASQPTPVLLSSTNDLILPPSPTSHLSQRCSAMPKSPQQANNIRTCSPSFNITFIRPPTNSPLSLSPHHPHFLVPLWFSKLDLRDSLLRAYNVQSLHIRSCVVRHKLYRQGSPNLLRPAPYRWHKPNSTKKMVVYMKEGFVWPAELTEEQLNENWQKDMYHASEKESRREQETMREDASKRVKVRERRSIAEQAADVLRGKERWRPSWVE